MEGDKIKILNDPIYETIELRPLWVKIIDTPEFQRLRYIRQLGCSNFVYHTGIHTRFDHSIGVCHLAYTFAKILQQRHPDLITDKEISCVAIAGLCHDLGHGPFSHTWEVYMQMAVPEANWRHETHSVKIFNRIWNKNKLEKGYGLGEKERVLICNLIIGDIPKDHPRGKEFLFEIVANKKNGIDVDKWDYFRRDKYFVGMDWKFQYTRLMALARIQETNGVKSLHYKASELGNIYNMFYNRWHLFQRVYKHRVARVIERMVIDAMLKADDDIYFLKGKKLSEAINNLDDFLQLRDSIYDILLYLEDDHPSKKIIARIESRKLYKCVGFAYTPKTGISHEDIEKELKKGTNLNSDHFYIDVATFDYGKRHEDPIKFVNLCNKDGKAVKPIKDTSMRTNQFEETKLMCVSRETDENTLKTLKAAFERWFENYKIELELTTEEILDSDVRA